ncbi:hypothetical protein GYH30_015846 [Glycine max]|nr:hypothetical protein GYH30_015846 [Glycine max]
MRTEKTATSQERELLTSPPCAALRDVHQAPETSRNRRYSSPETALTRYGTTSWRLPSEPTLSTTWRSSLGGANAGFPFSAVAEPSSTPITDNPRHSMSSWRSTVTSTSSPSPAPFSLGRPLPMAPGSPSTSPEARGRSSVAKWWAHSWRRAPYW